MRTAMAEDKLGDLIVRILVDLDRPVYTTSLVKLMYLIDYLHFRCAGRTATGAEYIWDEYGPNAQGHIIVKAANRLEEAERITIKSAPGGDRARVHHALDRGRPTFDPVLEAIVHDVLAKYGSMELSELVAASKETEPFEHSRPGRKLVMSMAPRRVPSVTNEDWERHLAERRSGAGKSIAEIKAKYDID